jgi:hypothetical protein
MLGYFSLVGLLRLHSLLGDFYQAIKVLFIFTLTYLFLGALSPVLHVEGLRTRSGIIVVSRYLFLNRHVCRFGRPPCICLTFSPLHSSLMNLPAGLFYAATIFFRGFKALLKASLLSAYLIESGSWFHGSITLTANEYFLPVL